VESSGRNTIISNNSWRFSVFSSTWWERASSYQL